MRVLASLVLGSMIIVAPVMPTAAETAAQTPDRNPIVWLFEDISELLTGNAETASNDRSKEQKPTVATTVGKQPADAMPETIVTEAGPPAGNAISRFFNSLAALFTSPAVTGDMPNAANKPTSGSAPVAATEQTAPSSPAQKLDKAAATHRNPLEWLLSDLARIFQPTLEIDDSRTAANASNTEQDTAVAPEVAETRADTPDATELPAVAPAEIVAGETPGATTETAPETIRNPVTWLIADIGALFSGQTDVSAPAADAAPPEADHAGLLAAPHLDLATAPAPAERATAENSPGAERIIVKNTPWDIENSKAVFDPHRSVFSGEDEAASRTPKAAPVKPPVGTETVAAATTPPQPAVIRKRAAPAPENRNYASLGHDYKAVTPDQDDTGFLTRLFDDLLGPDGETVDREIAAARQANEPIGNKISDRIVPEEDLDLGYSNREAPAERSVEKIGEGPLQDFDLYMGKSTMIGTPYAKDGFGAEDCIERPLHGSVFCLADLHWPAEISQAFAEDTAFTLPGEAVIRFENGAISRVYAIFPAPAFADVVKYMQHRFGPPGEREVIWMPVMEAPQLPNTTFRWKAISKDRRDTLVLEVRNYDDQRRSFANMEHGMVRMYRQGSRPIFKHISTMDLMLMQRKRVARAPVEVNAPPPQKSQP